MEKSCETFQFTTHVKCETIATLVDTIIFEMRRNPCEQCNVNNVGELGCRLTRRQSSVDRKLANAFAKNVSLKCSRQKCTKLSPKAKCLNQDRELELALLVEKVIALVCC